MFFWYGMCVRSRYTTMENLEVIAQQILWQIGLLYPCSQLWVSEAVTTLCKLTRIDSVCKYLHKYICSIICLLLLIFYVFELSPFYCILTMQNLVVLAWKMTVLFSLVYTHKCHALGDTFLLNLFCQFLQGVNVNYHVKFGSPR